MRRLLYILVLIYSLIVPCSFSAQGAAIRDEDGLFSLKRYGPTYLSFRELQQTIKADSYQSMMIRRLADSFTSGFQYLADADIDKAISEFRKIRRQIPEYLHADLILALLYEEKGEYGKAAYSYRSFLDKLRKLQRGDFRLTSKLITETVSFPMPDHEYAHELIRERMQARGIDIDTVRVFNVLPFIIVAVIILALSVYLVFKKAPFARRFVYRTKARMSDPGEYWICMRCGQENLNVSLSCHNCGSERKA